jgi:predicted Zn-ribbon and HTH transcriptional regulator
MLRSIERVFDTQYPNNVHLCGHRFQPVRDPSRFPVCPRCKELASLLDD